MTDPTPACPTAAMKRLCVEQPHDLGFRLMGLKAETVSLLVLTAHHP